MKLERDEIKALIRDIIYDVDRIEHSNRSVLEHLIGTFDLLLLLGADRDTLLAGSLHNIYDTQNFKLKRKYSIERDAVKESIGAGAECLIFLFSNLIWSRFNSVPPVVDLTDYSYFFSIGSAVNHKEFSNVVLMFFANIIEQVAVIPQPRRVSFVALLSKYERYLEKDQINMIYSALNV